MPTVTITTAQDRESALKMRDLLGGDAGVGALKAGHPLTLGFSALRKSEAGIGLQSLEKIDLNTLIGYAKTLYEFEGDWAGVRPLVAKKLRDVKECPSLLFELTVGRVLSAEVEVLRWSAFDESTPDWSASQPVFEIECKFARKPYRDGDYQSYLTAVARQHPDRSVALVAAIGFTGSMSPRDIEQMHSHAQRHLPWMTQHPHLSAVMVFGRQPSSGRPENLFGRTGVRYAEDTVVWIRNDRAAKPLDPSFSPGGDGPHEEWSLPPGPQPSMAAARLKRRVEPAPPSYRVAPNRRQEATNDETG